MSLSRRSYRIFVVGAVLAAFFFPRHAFADALGDQRSFFVNSQYDSSGRSSIDATLRVVGEHAYFYIDDVFWSGLSSSQREHIHTKLRELAVEFDARIYPTETQFWGSERIPGVDDDTHVTVLMHPLTPGSGGYFDSIHGYRRSQAGRSNEREMITIGTHSLGTGYEKMFLAHEFQHLISFYQKELLRDVSEEVWLNELRSEFTASLLGYNTPFTTSNLARRLPTFLQEPSDSITEWPNVSRDYAVVAMFAEYLTGRYGFQILSDTLRAPLVGIASLNDWLANAKYPERFEDVFLDWMIATWRNDASVRFGYANGGLRTLSIAPSYQVTVQPGAEYLSLVSIEPWQPVWHAYYLPESVRQSRGALQLEFVGQEDARMGVAYALVWDDGTMQVQRAYPQNGKLTSIIFSDDGEGTAVPTRRVHTVLVAVTNTAKLANFGGDEPGAPLTLRTTVIDRENALNKIHAASAILVGRTDVVDDGTLVKRSNNEPEMYVVSGRYKRYLRPEVIRLYGHLDPARVTSLESTQFDSYVTANYIKGIRDEKIYAVWPDGTKHWLRMTGEYFAQSGRDWNAVFVVNDAELDAYATGSDITR